MAEVEKKATAAKAETAVATPVEAKRKVTLDEIKYNEANKTNAILACIPVAGLIMMFVEKNDQYVRYMGAQSTILGAVSLVSILLTIIPILGWCLEMVIYIGVFVLVVMMMVKTSKGERYDVPVVSGIALSVMNMI